MHKAPIFAAIFLAGTLAFANAAQASNNVLFIFDASNSMWGQIDGVAKIETARDALNEALGAFDADMNLGLMAFGHRHTGDCDDIELLADIGARTGSGLRELVDGITPRGRTPLAGSLEASRDVLLGPGRAGGTIVLISDGIETCGGDPCAVAAELGKAGVDVRIHTVGLDVDEKAERQLICVAEAGGGEYFRAEDGAALHIAMAGVRELAEAPADPKREVVFRDDFSSGDLDEHWEVVNPNPDFFIVEGGALLMVNDGVFGFPQQETPNLIRLDHPLPDGDWDLVVRLKAELKTGQDSVWMGLHTDSDNFMGAHLWTQRAAASWRARHSGASSGSRPGAPGGRAASGRRSRATARGRGPDRGSGRVRQASRARAPSPSKTPGPSRWRRPGAHAAPSRAPPMARDPRATA